MANSHAQSEWLARKWWLKGKVSCIYNGVDPGPAPAARAAPESGEHLRLVAVGRVGPEKNAINLIRGLMAFHRECGYVPQVSWVGERDWGAAGRLYCRRLENFWRVHPRCAIAGAGWALRRIFPECFASIMHWCIPPFTRGCLTSCARRWQPGCRCWCPTYAIIRGWLSTGNVGFCSIRRTPGSIAAAIRALVQLSAADWRRFSGNARRYAEENLHVETMISAYESLFVRLLGDHNSVRGVSGGDCR